MWGLDLKPGYVALNETGLWDIYGVYIFSSYGAYISSSNQNRRWISALAAKVASSNQSRRCISALAEHHISI